MWEIWTRHNLFIGIQLIIILTKYTRHTVPIDSRIKYLLWRLLIAAVFLMLRWNYYSSNCFVWCIAQMRHTFCCVNSFDFSLIRLSNWTTTNRKYCLEMQQNIGRNSLMSIGLIRWNIKLYNKLSVLLGIFVDRLVFGSFQSHSIAFYRCMAFFLSITEKNISSIYGDIDIVIVLLSSVRRFKCNVCLFPTETWAPRL